MKNYYRRILISSMEYVVIPSLNTMQPAVSKIAPSPNQPKVGIENPGKFHDDAVVPYSAIFSNLLRNRHLTCHQCSSIASSKLN